MEAKHTPTPWEYFLNKHGTQYRIAGDNCFPIAALDMYGSEGHGPTKKVSEANAAFIVRAVNNHEALIEALQKCLEAANAHEAKALHSGKLHEVIRDYARSALAAAKGDA